MRHLLYKGRWLRHLISAPFIYAMIIPAVILDIFLEIYHRIAFPLYGIPIVKRSNYIKVDRYKLSYLSWIQKINCIYCGYVNGLFQYAAVIGGETEKYWCGIHHEPDKEFVTPSHHQDFLKYGDRKEFEEFKRCKLSEESNWDKIVKDLKKRSKKIIKKIKK